MIKLLQEKLKSASKIAIFAHEYIDGDALGSSLALGVFLTKMYKQISYFTPIPIPGILHFVPGHDMFQNIFDFAEYDLLIFSDIADITRIKQFYNINPTYFQNKFKIVIDHHFSNHGFGQLNLIDSEQSSTCELLFSILTQIDKNLIDSQIATYLYLGIVTDTGNFLFDCTTNHTWEVTNQLIGWGANWKLILDKTNITNNYNVLKFLGILINRITKFQNIYYSYYSISELIHDNISREQISYLLRIIQTVSDIDVFMLFSEEENNIKCSIRSRSQVSHLIAQLFQGGGHQKAAGFEIIKSDNFLGQIEKCLHQAVSVQY